MTSSPFTPAPYDVPERFSQGSFMLSKRLALVDLEENELHTMQMKNRAKRYRYYGTVYGRQHTHCFSPNVSAVSPSFRELWGRVASKYYNLSERRRDGEPIWEELIPFCAEHVDNESLTSLFFSLMLLSWTIIIHGRTTVVSMTKRVSRDLLPDTMPLAAADYDNAYWKLLQVLFGDECGMSNAYMDRPVDVDQLILRKNESAANEPYLDVTYRLLEAPPYHDENISIDKSRFLTAGFQNGRYLIGDGHRASTVDNSSVLGLEGPEEVEAYVAASASRNGNDFFVKADGISTTTLGILVLALFCRRRSTPFLCDQTLRIATPEDRVVFVGLRTAEAHSMLDEFRATLCHSFTADDVKSAVSLLATNHAAYDDVCSAFLHVENYVCQPLPDSPQAHVYFDAPWRSVLPPVSMRVSAFRAYFAACGDGVAARPEKLARRTEGEAARGVEASRVGKGDLRRVNGPVNDAFTLAMRRNTLWFWGTFLRAQRRLLAETSTSFAGAPVAGVDGGRFSQAAVVSAVTGLRSCVARGGNYTAFEREGLREFFCGERGTIVDTVRMEGSMGVLARYVARAAGGTEVLWQFVAAPANAAGVIGERGGLLDGTPWGKEFGVEFWGGGRRPVVRGLMDVWGCGVVCAWNGYRAEFWEQGVSRERFGVVFPAVVEGLCYPAVLEARGKQEARGSAEDVVRGGGLRLVEAVAEQNGGGELGDVLTGRGGGGGKRFRWVESTEVVYSCSGRQGVPIKVWRAGEMDDEDGRQRLWGVSVRGGFEGNGDRADFIDGEGDADVLRVVLGPDEAVVEAVAEAVAETG